MNLVFVGDRCCDHSPSSGYDQICSIFPRAGWLSGRELEAGRLSWYREPLPGYTASGSRQLLHVFYGDCSGSGLHDLLRERFPEAIIVSTVHQPISRLRHDPAGWRSLFLVDAILTVSETQARDLAEEGLDASIFSVPHGVWTHVFTPPQGGESIVRNSVLLVGNYHRDWVTAQAMIELLSARGVKSRILGSAAAEHLDVTDTRAELLARVSEAELCRLYQESAAVVLLHRDATASNVLLEAMAAGCPVICPTFPSLVGEYLADKSDAFGHGDYWSAVDRILQYIDNPELRQEKSSALLRRARRFDWSELLPHYLAVYKDVLARLQIQPRSRAGELKQ
jgi:glycosyltransferase involved in cell wall biosynthesis